MKNVVSLTTLLLYICYPTPVVGFAAVKKSGPPGELFPYQKEGVDRLVADQRLLLADEMGLGKTVQCISAVNRIGREDIAILIVCPKSVLGVWEYELKTWLDIPLQVQMASPKEFLMPFDGSVTLINYDICHKYREALQEADYDILICDEAHYLKSRSAKRTQAVLGDGSKKHPGIQSAYLWLLTGTPVLNRPVELYSLVRAIDPDEFSKFKDFADQYCDPKQVSHRGRFSMDYSGASNLVELSQRLEPIMLRRYKMDVLTQLPPKFRSCLCLTGSDTAEQERARLRAIMGGASQINQNLQDFGSEASDLLSYLGEFTDLDLEDPENYNKIMGSLATVRRESAMTKLEPSVELLEDIILSKKVVVFAHHRELILALEERFGDKAVCVIGGMDTDDRSDAVRRFQEDDDVRIFVGSIRAAGVGLTLTAASHVVFLEMDWSPGVMAQAEDRCHRVGQNDSVQVQYYVFKDTIDEWIAKSLLRKQSNIDQILPSKQDEVDSGYMFDFGKHAGLRMEDVPQNYLQFLVDKDVWRNRPTLWRALAQKGMVLEEPPPLDADEIAVEKLLAEAKEIDQPQESVAPTTSPSSLRNASPTAGTYSEYMVAQTDHPRVTVITKVPSALATDQGDYQAARDTTKETHKPNVKAATAVPYNSAQPIPRVALTKRPPTATAPKKPVPPATTGTEKEVSYVFDFGKHTGKKWVEAPPNYRAWILKEGVWENRDDLRTALTDAGLVLQKEAEEK